ncbi:G-patch domain and KOW motifs-containing protein isoform X2 [Perognathus longimembris pacificus]|uniref:G-patch domain and KOW motifs-containing protein isoform X2 n=1 Tax=Perognathus longimembris pacificus TaxID=214514 RepID=UPI002019E2B8|nr:G-patch domain and KOW motifs-containing protein isoform X2 [Perognathus longimembris pacificus]
MADPEEAVLRPSGISTATVSFGFTRTSSRRQFADYGASAETDPEEKEFLNTVQGREFKSMKPPETPQKLVIPVIQNVLRRQPLSQTPPLPTDSKALMDSELSQAVKELIEESKKSLEERENAGVDPTLAIPMIQKGCVPSGEETDNDEPQAKTVPKEADYEAVPVEAYGLAMLRGMGWKPGKGIGCKFNLVVKPKINSVRPKGLGLGANLTEAQCLASIGSHNSSRPGGDQQKDKDSEPQGLVIGGAVLVLSGPHRGFYGKVEGIDPDNVRAMIRLAENSHIVTVSEYCLRPVSQYEFDSNTLHNGKGRKNAQQHNETSSVKAAQNKDPWVHHKDSEKKRKKPADRQDGPATKNEKMASRRPHWLHRDLRVRFVDKLYMGGQYYNTKMIIEDVLNPDTCVCRTDNGQILEGEWVPWQLREFPLRRLIKKAKRKAKSQAQLRGWAEPQSLQHPESS